MGTIVKYRTSELYDTVVDEHNVFNSSYDFMMFLAILGYSKNNPVRDNFDGSANEGTRGEIGLENVYSNELYRVLMMSLAYQDTNDPEALVDSKKQIEVLTQYAAGGLEIAEREFGGTAGDPLNAIMNYIKNKREESEDFEGVLGDIVNSFDDEVLNTEED
jgi:dnd system-associated protein 4